MLMQETPLHAQAVRRVYENETPITGTTTTTSTTFHITCHPDGASGKDIILWDDIVAAFKDVIHVRNGTLIVPFLKGPDFKNLDPFRIAAVPGVTLDVIVKGQSARTESLSQQEQSRGTHSNHHNALPEGQQRVLSETHQEGAVESPHQGQHVTMDEQPDSNNPSIPPPSYNDINTSIHANNTTEPFRRAAHGDQDAQAALGDKYKCGYGIDQDFSKAFEWYLKAANQGHAGAQHNVGEFYRIGQGVDMDYSEAKIWYLKAAKQGNADAQHGIGTLYLHGLSVPRDYSQAASWLLKSAEQGQPRAQCSIGYMCSVGYGVPQDHTQAIQWYLKAADQGNAPAQFNLGWAYEYGRGVRQDLPRALEWYRKAADLGDTDAKTRVERLERERGGGGVGVEGGVGGVGGGGGGGGGGEGTSSVQVKTKPPGLLSKLFR